MRRSFLALLTVALLGVPGVAFAAATDCPPEVQAVTGSLTVPSWQVRAAIDNAADLHDVPRPVLRAIAYVESGWQQFDAGGPLVSATGCAVGLLQVPVDGYSTSDQVKLAENYVFNAGEGARLLRAAWTESQQAAVPAGGSADDDEVVENWFHAICGYGGCGTDATYPTLVANVIRDPFRYAPGFTAMNPDRFTKPQDANPAYVFPGEFQARYLPAMEFSFHDAATGVVSSTVAAPVHRLGTGIEIHPVYTGGYGPDAPHTTCTQCERWELAAGTGIAGRARWASSVTGPAQSGIVYSPTFPHPGKYRLRAWVPALGDAVLGTATYTIGGKAVTIDQNAKKNAFRALGDHTLSPGAQIVLGDNGLVAGRRIVADGLRVTAVPTLPFATDDRYITYGETASLWQSGLQHGDTGFGSTEWRATLYKRPLGTTTWRAVSVVTLSGHPVETVVRPTTSADYQLRWTSVDPAYVSAVSPVVRVRVAPRVVAWFSRDYFPAHEEATLRVTVAPSHAGRTVYLQRRTATGDWQNALSTRLSPESRAKFTFRKPEGKYWYRVHLPGHTDHTAATSESLFLWVTG